MTTLDRLTARIVQSPEGCWEWTGATNGTGYGVIAHQGRQSYTHRVAYTLLVGEIPDGKQIDHLCRNRGCCNPEHLEPVDTRTNLMRGQTLTAQRAAQTHCVNGHELSGYNVAVRPNGTRRCRQCHRERMRASYRRSREVDA